MLQVIIGHTQQMRNIVSTVPPPCPLKPTVWPPCCVHMLSMYWLDSKHGREEPSDICVCIRISYHKEIPWLIPCIQRIHVLLQLWTSLENIGLFGFGLLVWDRWKQVQPKTRYKKFLANGYAERSNQFQYISIHDSHEANRESMPKALQPKWRLTC